MLKAYSLSIKLQKDFDLVCCGGGEITKDEKKIISELKIDSSKIIQIEGSDDDLCYLYKNASAFIFPSKYEGLGLPPLEAMSCGCPVIISDIPVLRELYDDSALYIDPYDSEDIKRNNLKLLDNSNIYNNLVESGLKKSEEFSWEKSADKIIDLIKGLS